MAEPTPLQVALDLTGTFAFALNGALTAVRTARLDIVGVITLGVVTAVGGGIVRDVLLGRLPPATFSDWRYLAVAALGGLVAFTWSHRLERLSTPIMLLDAAGLGLFAVTGASVAMAVGIGPVQAVLLGVMTGVGGGTVRDVMLGRIPTVLRAELYAIPALLAAVVTVGAVLLDVYGLVAALVAAGACFALRVVAVRLDLHAPRPRVPGQDGG